MILYINDSMYLIIINLVTLTKLLLIIIERNFSFFRYFLLSILWFLSSWFFIDTMFARSVKYLYETNRFRLGKLDRTSSRRFLFAYRTKTEPCDWRSLHRWLSPPETPATTWTQMAPPSWCHPSCYLHPPRIQGWRGTTSMSKGKIDSSYSDHYSIFLSFLTKNFHLSGICYSFFLLDANLETRGFHIN